MFKNRFDEGRQEFDREGTAMIELDMEVDTDVKPTVNLRNPFIRLTMTNNNDPFDVKSISYLTVENGNVVSKMLIAAAGRTVSADLLTMYYGTYLYAFNFSDLYDKYFTDLVNVELISDQDVCLEIIDPTKDASASLYFAHNPLPDE